MHMNLLFHSNQSYHFIYIYLYKNVDVSYISMARFVGSLLEGRVLCVLGMSHDTTNIVSRTKKIQLF